MKLITKTQRIYLLLIVALLLVWGTIFLVFISSEIGENIDETLAYELETTISKLKTQATVPAQILSTRFMEITPIVEIRNTSIVFSDTSLVDPEDGEMELFRQIQSQIVLDGQPIRITLRKSQMEYDDLFTSILFSEIVFIVLLIACIAVVNRKILQRIWAPFRHTIDQLTSYKINKRKSVTWQDTDIDEFRQLNRVLKEMLNRIEQDYERLKQFTENASHEIQTPLSVIRNQTEILFQDERLSEEQWKRLQTIKSMADKLSRLNRALLLLTKIENNQYWQRKEVNITELLKELTDDYRKLAASKDITLNEDLEPGVRLELNSELAEVLFRNLLSNAVTHNQKGGSIDLTLRRTHVTITNTGAPPEEGDTSKLFDRFQKGHADSDSLGLGLSLVSTIANAYDYSIDYSYENQTHTIKIDFNIQEQ